MGDAIMNVRPKNFTQFRSIAPCPFHRLASAPGILLAVSVTIIIAGWMYLPVKADVPMSEYITVFFEQEGQPYDRPVSFRIQCYGYKYDPGPAPPTRVPGSYEPESVYRISGNCPHYGCKITHSLYLNYIQIEYCDLVAVTEGQEYTLPKFASRPVDTCDGIECTLRVELPIPVAVLPLSPTPPTSATTSPAGDSPLPFQIDTSRAYEEQFLIALVLSLLIEVPILLAMVRFAFKLRTIGTVRLSIAGVLASCLTLPYLWFIAPVIFGGVYAIIVGEIVVFLVEAGVYALVLQVSIRRALLVSLIANLASLAVGLVLLY
jgi:hypothetical protein